jgi:hypothetical protein
VKKIYFGPKMSFFWHFSKNQKIDHFWLTKKATTFEQLIAFGLSFFNLCVSRLLVQTTRFVVKYLQKSLTCKAETCSTVHKVPSLQGYSTIEESMITYQVVKKIYFGPKMSFFLTFFQKPENRPLLARQKGHNFWTAQPILIIFVPKFPIFFASLFYLYWYFLIY